MNLQQIASQAYAEATTSKHSVKEPRVIVLTGLQYSGKSYLAAQIEERNFAHFWATKIKKEFAIENDDMIQVALEFVRLAITNGLNVVVDYVNHKKAVRLLFQELAKSLNANYSVVFIDIPKEERLRRREKNVIAGDQPGRRVISLEQMEEFENDFENPSADENVIVLRTNEDSRQFITHL